MSNYVGVKCPVCSKKFTQADDIVVCPVCGAPHHRGCYAQENACAFAADHLSGKEWRAPPPDPVYSAGDSRYPHNGTGGGENGDMAVVCSACQSKNPRGAIFCQVCGTRINFDSGNFFNNPYIGIDPVSMVYGGVKPDEKIEDETARDLAAYVGPSSAYYLPRFKKMVEMPYAFTFNFSAMIFSFLYFFYRKMYLIGGILLGLYVVGLIPNFLLMWEFLPQVIPQDMYQYFGLGSNTAIDPDRIAYYQQLAGLANFSSTINFTLRLTLLFFANRFYYTKAISDVKRIREAGLEKRDEIAYCNELREKGGVSKAAVIILASAYFAVSFAFACCITYKYMLMGGFPLQ